MSLHAEIMNLPAKKFAPGEMNDAAYNFGHRDARHAAAELALKADAELAAWRERFPGYVYRPQDDCVSLRAG